MRSELFALFCLSALQIILWDTMAAPQEPALELPVQLVGFPVIILAVRLANFVRKLQYSVSPRTYVSRVKREAISSLKDEMIDVTEAEKRLVAEFGENVCIYTRVCLHYASKAARLGDRKEALDWEHVLSQYKSSPDKQKEFYLLSVFLGDILGSTNFCNQIAKRGRACRT